MANVMEQMPAISQKAASMLPRLAGRGSQLYEAIRSLRRDPLAARSRRIVLLLVLVWIIGLFDLAFTVLARKIGGFEEANTIVARMVHVTGLLVAFKIATLFFASVILLKYRHRKFTEFSCWGICVVHMALAFLWLTYYAWLH